MQNVSSVLLKCVWDVFYEINHKGLIPVCSGCQELHKNKSKNDSEQSKRKNWTVLTDETRRPLKIWVDGQKVGRRDGDGLATHPHTHYSWQPIDCDHRHGKSKRWTDIRDEISTNIANFIDLSVKQN